MNLEGILFYAARAARFASAVCLIYAAGRYAFLKTRKRTVQWKRELIRLLAVGYLAALAEIVALRGGTGNTRELRWIPLRTTLATLKDGLWPFVYNFAGNVVWFVPLGMILSRKSPKQVLFAGAAVSLMLECTQWLLQTGVTDVDDVLINALGAYLGCIIMEKARQR